MHVRCTAYPPISPRSGRVHSEQKSVCPPREAVNTCVDRGERCPLRRRSVVGVRLRAVTSFLVYERRLIAPSTVCLSTGPVVVRLAEMTIERERERV